MSAAARLRAFAEDTGQPPWLRGFAKAAAWEMRRDEPCRWVDRFRTLTGAATDEQVVEALKAYIRELGEQPTGAVDDLPKLQARLAELDGAE